ncbi:MAG: hypothetical protein ACETWG_01635 [Candidatus Neomarinimicrobiota bacterium]
MSSSQPEISTDYRITLNESIRRKIHALQTMVRKIVHETNNYYSILQGYVSLLEIQLADKEDLRKFLPPMDEALRAGIKLNERLAGLYQARQIMVAETDFAGLVGEVCAGFAREQNFTVAVAVEGDLEPIPLEEPAVRALVTNLCHLAKETNTTPASITLCPVELDEKALMPMIFDSRSGPYICLRMAISLADYSQEEETEFLNPFALDPDSTRDLGLPLLFNTLRNHGGNLDVALQNECITLAIYFPQ